MATSKTSKPAPSIPDKEEVDKAKTGDEAKGAPAPEASDPAEGTVATQTFDPDLIGVQGSASTLHAWENSKAGKKWIEDHNGEAVAPTPSRNIEDAAKDDKSEDDAKDEKGK